MLINKGLSILTAIALAVCLNPVAANADEGVDAESSSNIEFEAGKTLSSRAWFEHQGSAGAIAILDDTSLKDGVPRNSAIEEGGVHDATSIVNMKAAIQHLKRCNELRALHGLEPLLVTDTHMAIAQSQLDATRDSGRGHSGLYGVSENLAYDSSSGFDPFISWYTREKNLLDKDPDIPAYKIGHYKNIIDPDAKYTGFAVIRNAGDDSMYPIYSNQVFDEFLFSKDDAIKSYTVEEFEQEFLAWYDEVEPEGGFPDADPIPIHIGFTTISIGEAGVYDGGSHEPAVEVTDGDRVLIEGEDYAVSYPANTRSAGTYTLTVSGMGDYAGESKKSYVVGRAPLLDEHVSLSYSSALCDGSAKKPKASVRVNGVLQSSSGYEVTYWDEDKAEQVDPLNAGAYWAKVTAKDSANMAGTVWKKFVVLPKRQMADAEIALSEASFIYNGRAQKPSVAVSLDGKTLMKNVDYEVLYDSGRKRSGAYGVTVSGMGSYEGERTLSFEITDADLETSDVRLSYAATAYDGSAKKPAATVRVGGVSQLKSEYEVTYWDPNKTRQVSPKLVGAYSVKVEARPSANTTGAVWKKLTVNPKATANLKLTALNNGFKASWTKRTVQCSGYQVAYKQVGTSAWKTKAVTSCRTNFKSVAGLKDKKSYQVKVRAYKTVNGVKYYSAWTSVKTIKTK